MNNTKNTMDDIKKLVVGKDNLSSVKKINNAIKDIAAYKNNSGRAGYIDLVKSVI